MQLEESMKLKEQMKDHLAVLEKLINSALDELYEKDEYLVTHRALEQACVFRFGHYLQNLMDAEDCFKNYNLDLEYNRNGPTGKRTSSRRGQGAKPDLIIHKRGSNEYNLLIIEFKRGTLISNGDVQKVKEFMDPKGDYKYLCGKTISLPNNRESVVIYDVE